MPSFLRHLFFPQESNNHRPKILHLTSIFLVIAFLLLTAIPLSSFRYSHPQVLGAYSNISFKDLLLLTNQSRASEKIPALTINDQLSAAADMKAKDMLEKNYWAHNGPDGLTPWDFIKKSGYDYVYAGENLARGFSQAPDVINAWMASPEHRANMLSRNFQEVGFAVREGKLNGEDTVLVVEELGGQQVLEPKITPGTLSTQTEEKKSVGPPDITPTVNSKSTTSSFIIGILGIFIATLVLDFIVFEKKKLVRFSGHNLDHILFLILVIVTIIILSRGVVL